MLSSDRLELDLVASRLHRLIRIIRILRRGSYPSVQSLCETLQVKERTIFNDLKELKEELGVDVQFDRARRGYFLASDDLELGFNTLTEETAFLLLLAFKLMAAHVGRQISAPLEELFNDEIGRCLGLSSTEMKDFVRSEHNVANRMDLNMFVQLCKACSKTRPLKINLRSSHRCESVDGKNPFSVIPLCLLISSNELRVVYHNGDQKEYALDLSCIESLSSECEAADSNAN